MADYEFSDAENRQINELRRNLLQVSWLFIVLGLLQLVAAFLVPDATARWITLGAGILLLALGWLFMRPLDNFRRIVMTQGQDIRQVVIAMKDLRAACLVAEVIFGILVAGIIVELMRLYSGVGLD
jgi:cytochrome c biogenesis protein CcdA